MAEGSNTEIESWVEETSAFERVTSIVFDIVEPRTAEHVASKAQVSGRTAREHLERLVTLETVLADEGDDGTVYYPDPGYLRYREVRSVARDHDRSELIEIADSTRDVLDQYREKAGVETYDELEDSIAEGDLSDQELIDRKNIAADWLSTRQQLDRIEDAIDWYDVLAAELRTD